VTPTGGSLSPRGQSFSAGGQALPIAVIGGGISGLCVAHHLLRGGAEVRLFEASARFGGNLRTEQHDGFLYDVGPDAFLRTKAAGLELCAEFDLSPELIEPLPQASRLFVAFDGRLHVVPEGLTLGVPRHPLALLATSLLSPSGKLRALAEPLIPRASGAEEETIQAFLVRRLGRELAERLVAPLLAGVFAGDPERLGIQAAFPQLVAYERRFGSLTAGTLGAEGGGARSLLAMLRQLSAPRAAVRSPFVSLTRGMGSLVDRLVERLPVGVAKVNAPVAKVAPTPEGIRLELAGGEHLLARHVILAGPPWMAARLLGSFDPELGEQLSLVRGTPTATVFFGLRQRELERDLDASGFIVPPGEGRILAATWVSSKWPGRAPPGAALVRAFVGGPRGAALFAREDAEVARVARAELSRLMGDLGRPLFTRVFRYERGSPQPDVGHGARLQEILAGLRRWPRVSVIGPGYDGVGIPDCARQARLVAEALLNGGPHSGVV
jgi:protoporphyrinogen/coproporphyrinogen III oxidase